MDDIDENDTWCCWEYYKANRGLCFYMCGGCGKSWLWTFDSSGQRGWEEMV